MQAKVADMYVALNSARAYVYQVARACDAGQTTRFDAAGAILYASESAVRVANEAVQALGGAGYTKDWPVERFFRDAKLARHRRRHQRDPPDADRAGTDRGGGLALLVTPAKAGVHEHGSGHLSVTIQLELCRVHRSRLSPG
jgi:hypothetical protein